MPILHILNELTRYEFDNNVVPEPRVSLINNGRLRSDIYGDLTIFDYGLNKNTPKTDTWSVLPVCWNFLPIFDLLATCSTVGDDQASPRKQEVVQ